MHIRDYRYTTIDTETLMRMAAEISHELNRRYDRAKRLQDAHVERFKRERAAKGVSHA